MGVSGARQIQRELMHGLPGSTPVAIIQNASLPKQRQSICNLSELHSTIARDKLGSPSVIVVGDVIQGVLASSVEHTPDRSVLFKRSA
jgi:uroporphyrin-III C-methyltransferase